MGLIPRGGSSPLLGTLLEHLVTVGVTAIAGLQSGRSVRPASGDVNELRGIGSGWTDPDVELACGTVLVSCLRPVLSSLASAVGGGRLRERSFSASCVGKVGRLPCG